jgi:putative nucleotidyltransferase with HDIG domain
MIKKIRTEDLEVGMFVEDFNIPWMDHPFLTNKKKLKSAKEIALIVEHGIAEVYINTRRGKDSANGVPVTEIQAEIGSRMRGEVLAESQARALGAPPAEPAVGDGTPYGEELRDATKAYSEAKSVVKGLLQDARMGRSINGEAAAAAVDKMVDSIFRNREALTSLSRLKSFDEYTFHHSVNVTVLALTLGRDLGIVKGELRRLGIGAMLHDVGKMRVPEAILNKPGRLTENEFAIMKTHPLHGAKILMQAQGVAEECAAVALNHHERISGVGYPRGLQGPVIGKFGLIAAIADVYDAITSDRVYQKGMSSHEALQRMYEWSKTDFHPIYVQKFIQCLGIYPTGSAVLLDTGEVAVVCRQNRSDLLRPWVRIVSHSLGGVPTAPVEVDLSKSDPVGGTPFTRAIVSALSASDFAADHESRLLPAVDHRVA